MLAAKTNTKEKSVTSPKPESKKGVAEETAPQIQLNPLWHSLATHVGNNAAGGAGDPSPIQRKPSQSTSVPHIQRMCAECEEELNTTAETPIQTKLTVGAPDDLYEKEADAVADKVMRMPVGGNQDQLHEDAPSIQSKSLKISPIQRLCAECTEELSGGDTPSVQSKSNGKSAQPSAPNSVSNTINSPGSGSPLNESIRSRIESVLGADLSSVRVHSNATAQDASRSLNAKAFTHKNNIFMGKGQSQSDVRLMAHETVHTVQQGGVQRTPNIQQKEIPQELKNSLEVSLFTDKELFARKKSIEKILNKFNKSTPQTAELQEQLANVELELRARGKLREGNEASGDFTNKGWSQINELGIVYKTDGANLRDQPRPGSESRVLQHLPQNSKLFVLAHNKKDKWFAVTVVGKGGAGKFGYIADWLVWRKLPEPNVNVYKIKTGDSPLGITFKKYKGFNDWGQDKRYVVNALVYVNTNSTHNGSGQSGIRKKNDQVNKKWFESLASSDVYIWLPSEAFLKSLYSKVVKKGGGTGSISADLWNVVKSGLNKLAYGVAFVGGLVHGFVKSLWDAIAGLLKMVYDILVSLFTGNIIKDAKELWGAVSKMTWNDIKAAMGAWATKQERKLNSKNPWVAGHAHGYLTGYIMAEAAQLLVSAGTLAAAKAAIWGSRLGKAIKATAAYQKMAKGITELSKTGSKTKKLMDGAGKAIRASKPFKHIGVARSWIGKALNLSVQTLGDLSLAAINRLRKLPDWAFSKLRKLSSPAKRFCLGCASPCKVDLDAITIFLSKMTPAASAAAKPLKSIDDILGALPAGMAKQTIKAKLKKHKALTYAIKEAGLTNKDLEVLAKFLTGADKTNPAMAYRSFSRFITSIVPAKVGPDINKFNKIAEGLITLQPRMGSALKGAMFENFAKIYITKFGNSSRLRFVNSALKKTRSSDGFIKSSKTLWDFKHTAGKVPLDQANDYFKILSQGLKSSDGTVIRAVNYLFPTEAAAKANQHLKKLGFGVYYLKPPKTVSKI